MINRAQVIQSPYYRDRLLMLGSQSPRHGGGKFSYATLTFHELEQGEAIPFEGSTHIDKDGCQELIDSLWNAGFRPTNIEAGEERVQAIKDHLGDMRAIVANKLNVDLP